MGLKERFNIKLFGKMALIGLGIISLILIFVWGPSPRPATSPPPKTLERTNEEATLKGDAGGDLVTQEEIERYLLSIKERGYKDPFLSRKEIEWDAFLSDLRRYPLLQGIMVVGGKRVALLNGRVMKVGDIVDGYTIVRIDGDGVRLLKGKRGHYLPLNPIKEKR
ncbi:MAG: hypothetical protein JRI46_09360 [Deltaproteobacteria bacterium]|nr:hypothetical protein [Deltaproteobacteria bacterium]